MKTQCYMEWLHEEMKPKPVFHWNEQEFIAELENGIPANQPYEITFE